MADKTPTRRRSLAGAAVAGAVQRPVRYPKTISLMVSQDIYDAIGEAAAESRQSKAEVARDWLEKGMRG